MGVTFDILKISGTCPDNIDSLHILVKGKESGPLASLISLLGRECGVSFFFIDL